MKPYPSAASKGRAIDREFARKSPGQLAYEDDLRRFPRYSHDGSPRRQWDELPESVQESWHRNPTPRNPAVAQHFQPLSGA